MRIYVDLDETLVANDIDEWSGVVRRIYARPGAHEFLGHLAPYGKLWLLTRAERGHANRALQKLGSAAGFFKGMVTREDMVQVQDRVDAILSAPISDESKQVLLNEIEPLYPAGVIFDNDEAYSYAYVLKTRVVGADFNEWIEVEPFTIETPDLGGLERAFSKFLERVQKFSMRGALV